MSDITETKITNVRSGHRGELRNAKWDRSVVFINSDIIEMIDGWFTANNIGALDYKCRTWDALVKSCTKELGRLVLKHLGINPDTVKFSYSTYAGCTCPCSKGYIIDFKGNSHPTYSDKWIWMDVLSDEQAREVVKHKIMSASGKLYFERLAHTKPVPAPIQLDLTK
jgi:hypothetical protein